MVNRNLTGGSARQPRDRGTAPAVTQGAGLAVSSATTVRPRSAVSVSCHHSNSETLPHDSGPPARADICRFCACQPRWRLAPATITCRRQSRAFTAIWRSPGAQLDEAAAASMISGYRANNGLPAVTLDPDLTRMAQGASRRSWPSATSSTMPPGKPFMSG